MKRTYFIESYIESYAPGTALKKRRKGALSESAGKELECADNVLRGWFVIGKKGRKVASGWAKREKIKL